MKIKRTIKRITNSFAATALSLSFALPALAQDGTDAASAAADANNPLASVTAFNMQAYFIDSFTDLPGNVDGGQFWLRYAQPVSFGNTNWLFRASLPYNNFPVGQNFGSQRGVGDVDMFMAYQFKNMKPGVSFGLGPQVVMPTASKDTLGSDQWQVGVANVYFNGSSPKYQFGYLAIYRVGVGSTPDGRERPSVGAFQPIYFWQLGNGWYTGGAPVWTYDFQSDNYNMPIGLRLGKVKQYGKTTANFFVEPQWSIASKGAGQPDFQVYASINLQFR